MLLNFLTHHHEIFVHGKKKTEIEMIRHVTISRKSVLYSIACLSAYPFILLSIN